MSKQSKEIEEVGKLLRSFSKKDEDNCYLLSESDFKDIEQFISQNFIPKSEVEKISKRYKDIIDKLIYKMREVADRLKTLL